MLPHLQEEIEKKLGDVVTIEQRFNIPKFWQGHNGSHYYGKMHKWFLDDMEAMTGRDVSFSGEIDEELIWLQGTDMIDRLALSFDRYNGKYNGLYMLIVRRRKNGSPKISAREAKKLRTIEANQMILRFVAKANRLGYLLDD